MLNRLTPVLPCLNGLSSTVLLLGLGTLFTPGGALAQRPLGTDVSGYQPSINWTTVKNAGVTFAWSKATEGTYYTSSYFSGQEAGAKGVGIYIGAYHYARPSNDTNITGAFSADTEAAYFWNVAGGYTKYGGAYCVPMLDWEDIYATNGYNGFYGFTATMLSAWANEWCLAVSNYARAAGVPGVRPVIYTGTWYSNPANGYPGLNSSVTVWPAWISAYPSNPQPQTGGPSSSYPWSTWNIWQYADTNWSGGDSDVYNGNLAGFVQTFVIGGTNAPFITTNPTNLTRAVGASGTFSVKASGQAPLGFQWFFNGTPIPGATSSNYTIASIQLANAGGYTVAISNSYASISSSSAFLSVLSPLTNAPGCILAPPNMVDWWPAEGNPNDIYGPNNAIPTNGFSYVAGKQGLAFHFDGATSYLRVPGATSILANWTACMWVNRQNAPGTGAALMSDGTNELKLEQYNGTRQVGLTHFGVGDYALGYIAPAGVWTHLAFVGTSSGTSLYVNGAFRTSTNVIIPLPRAYIGVGYGSISAPSFLVDYMLGGLDELMCFNRALSASEISAIYAAGSAGLVRAPEFTGSGPLMGSQFSLNLRGQTGKSFSIYSSTDLAVWTRLSTGVANPSGSILYTDTIATNVQAFYRASQP
jgi:hypothetical protein